MSARWHLAAIGIYLTILAAAVVSGFGEFYSWYSGFLLGAVWVHVCELLLRRCDEPGEVSQ